MSQKRQKTAEPSLGSTEKKYIKRDTKEANAVYATLSDGQNQESDQQPGELLPGERGDKETQATQRQRRSNAERRERKRVREELDEQRRQAEEEW